MSVYTMSEARAALATLLDEVERGEHVTITRHGKPAARLVSPALINPRTIDLMHSVRQIAIELDEARSRPLSPAKAEGPNADELVARMHTDRGSW